MPAACRVRGTELPCDRLLDLRAEFVVRRTHLGGDPDLPAPHVFDDQLDPRLIPPARGEHECDEFTPPSPLFGVDREVEAPERGDRLPLHGLGVASEVASPLEGRGRGDSYRGQVLHIP